MPHLSDNKSIRNALLDLAKHRLVVSEGNTTEPRGPIGSPGRTGTAAQKLWRLTAACLDYADQIMGHVTPERRTPGHDGADAHWPRLMDETLVGALFAAREAERLRAEIRRREEESGRELQYRYQALHERSTAAEGDGDVGFLVG